MIRYGRRIKLLPLKDDDAIFWISRLPVSVSVWRDYKSDAFQELKDHESEVPSPYELCAAIAPEELKSYCEYLTEKYRLSLPKGHVFRPATESEIAVAYAEKETRQRCERTGRELESCIGFSSAVRATRFKSLSAALSKFTEWNRFGISMDGKLLISGLAMPHASNACDVTAPTAPVIWPHIVIAIP